MIVLHFLAHLSPRMCIMNKDNMLILLNQQDLLPSKIYENLDFFFGKTNPSRFDTLLLYARLHLLRYISVTYTNLVTKIKIKYLRLCN